MTTQWGNRAGGDIAGHDITNNNIFMPRQKTAMTRLIEKYIAENQSDDQLMEMIEQLQHFFSRNTNSDIRSLEEKLTAANRHDQLKDALIDKQNATKLIIRNQGSKTAQEMIAHLLADMVVNFRHTVSPLVQTKMGRQEIDKAILTGVIEPSYLFLDENPLGLTKLDISSLLFFLAGNCHIRWD